MYLEKLELQGFKSFAHKNKLIFSGIIDGGRKRGLTAVVGPNGSGKSNIADSIRWVLGEQSLKTLRGKKSDDVIFSGSDKRNQLGLAEVSLHLKNENPKQYQKHAAEGVTEEDWYRALTTQENIVITRRIYRNGNSEYLINNARCRLADIQMLLAKASVGQKTYSVIGQGMVESFLNTNASERKDFFDEATGVKQFQIKREQAMNKLEASYENLGQVELLLGEIRPRLKTLTRHMERLQRREELEKELQEKQTTYFASLWQKINEQIDGLSSRITAGEDRKREAEKELSALLEKIDAAKGELGADDDSALKAKVNELQAQKIGLVQKLAKLQAELENQLEAQGQFDISWLSSKEREIASEIEKTKNDIAAFSFNTEEERESLQQERLQAIGMVIDKNEQRRKETSALRLEQETIERKINKLEAIIEATLEARGQLDISWLSDKEKELGAIIKEGEQAIEAILADQADQTKEQEIVDKLMAIGKEADELSQALKEKNAEMKASMEAGSNKERLAQLVDRFLARLEEIKAESDLGKIRSLLGEAKQEFAKEMRAAINGQDEEKMKEIQLIQQKLIQLGEKKERHNATLAEMRQILSAKREKLSLLQEKQAQSERELTDIREKIAKSQEAPDADRIEAEKSSLKKQLEEITKKIAEAKTGIDNSAYDKKQEIISALNQARLEMSAKREKLSLLQEKQAQSERELADIREKIAKSQVKFDAGEINAEKARLQAELEKIETELSALNTQIGRNVQARSEKNKQIFEWQRQIQVVQAKINEASNGLQAEKISSTRLETRLEDLENDIREEGLEMISIKKVTVPADQEDETLGQRIAKLKAQLEAIGGIDPETGKEYEDTKERHDFLDKQTGDLKEATASLEKVILELDATIKTQFDQEFSIISEKFTEYFKILFNGGQAKILKIDKAEEEKAPEEATSELDNNFRKLKSLRKQQASDFSGIEIQATPPGKKISTISMLSGGEKALTAIALICAIINANPSPFVVLDEVDAALDEANSERLASILDDLSDHTQFIVITHNRASMKRASMLYGITMQADGVSQLLSVKLDEAKTK